MVRNRSISLGDHFASDVVRAGLRLLEEHEIRIAALRDALVEGENGGPAVQLDVDAFLSAQRMTGAE